MAPVERQPGEWESPITSQLITSATKRLGAVSFAPNGALLWLEGRPSEKGRQVLVRRPANGGAAEDVTPPPASGLNVRTRVQEYGGGEYVLGPGAVYFSNFADQRLYVQQLPESGGPPSEPRPLTAADSKQRFADGDVDATRNRLVCVVEDHSVEGEAKTTVGAVDLASGEVTALVQGADFYACPRTSPDGTKLAWVSWQHPNMPWDDTELWVADVAPDGSLSGQRKVAGGADTSVVLPQWGPDGSLFFVSDAPDGWWNLWVLPPRSDKARRLLPMAAEFAAPLWVFGQKPFHVLCDGRILAVFSDPKAAGSTLALIDPASGGLTRLDTPFTSYSGPTLAVHESPDGGVRVAAAAGSALQPAAIALLEAASLDALAGSKAADWQLVQLSAATPVDPGFLSEPRAIEFPTEDGLTAYMNFYPPQNKASCCLLLCCCGLFPRMRCYSLFYARYLLHSKPCLPGVTLTANTPALCTLQDFVSPPGALPPLLVKIHGGPTSQASTAFSLGLQYWTSRG
jgi:dipeptidyl aminopeptidase/acylaminoacyl peptidase